MDDEVEVLEVVEHKDGSAIITLEMTPVALQAIVQAGVISILTEFVEKNDRLNDKK
jgi:hypothetical protein